MRPRRIIAMLAVTLAVVLGLGGCAGSPWTGESQEVLGLLDYYERLNAMPPDEQRREHVAAQAAFERQPGDLQRLRLVMLLALPRAPWRDDARLLHLLGGLEPTPAERISPRRELALLIQKLVGDRQRLLRGEQKKVEDAQQKLDALRAIDRELQQKQSGR